MMPLYVYGPVPSRRLGRSLGVDIVPFKTCTYDCIYCQLGRTTQKTVCRSPLAPVEDIIQEVQDALKRVPRPDYVTVSGSGEPTLHSELDEVVSRIKRLTDVPVAMITNGSLLFREDVRKACLMADVVVPSLDTGDDAMFQYVNRPHESLSFGEVVDGLAEFRGEYRGQMWLEVFVLGGVTAVPDEILKIKQHTDRIKPDRIQLNTVVRPATEEYAFPVAAEEMAKLCNLLGRRAEVIVPFVPKSGGEDSRAFREDILSLVARRPCSMEDIANGLMMNRAHVLKYLDNLVSERLVTYTLRNGRVYYRKG
jgi:wyosine [tRNA(Phe)-imidazoG37] synthetase (radical SAM superfamily)